MSPSALSPRLHLLVDAVLPGLPMADVGTDHAHVPCALMRSGRVPRAIGVDRAGPALAGAAARAKSAGVELRLGDGLQALRPGEAATIVVAGMGGLRVLGMLRAAPTVLATTQRLVLQPNTELPALRRGAAALGWRQIAGHLLWGARRPWFTLVYERGAVGELTDLDACFDPFLRRSAGPAWLRWMRGEERRLAGLVSSLPASAPAHAALAAELALVRRALEPA